MPFVAPDTHPQAPKHQAAGIDLRDIEVSAPENRHWDDAMPVDVEAVGVVPALMSIATTNSGTTSTDNETAQSVQ